MYDRVNRNDDALVVLREAFRKDPRHPLLRHHAAITLLRHGTAPDVRDFFASVLKIDPDDAFAQFVMSLLDSYDVWVGELVSSIVQKRDGRRPFIISCPVWGQPFAGNFAHYICAALLSPNNLPALAKRYSVHLVIFTTAETESYLTADPLFALLESYAAVRFVHYTEKQIGYGKHGSPLWARRGLLFAALAGLLLRPQLQVRSHVLCPLCGACGGPRDGRARELPGRGHDAERRGVDDDGRST